MTKSNCLIRHSSRDERSEHLTRELYHSPHRDTSGRLEDTSTVLLYHNIQTFRPCQHRPSGAFNLKAARACPAGNLPRNVKPPKSKRIHRCRFFFFSEGRRRLIGLHKAMPPHKSTRRWSGMGVTQDLRPWFTRTEASAFCILILIKNLTDNVMLA